MNDNLMQELCSVFEVDTIGSLFGDGHINDTYIADKAGKAHILQKINTDVFTNPNEMMNNILRVTKFLQNKIRLENGNPERETLKFVKTIEGSYYYQASDGKCYRMSVLVDNSEALNAISDPCEFFEAAKAFGRFQRMLSDFPADELYETISEFHNTPNRLKALKEAVQNDVCGRLASCQSEVEYALSQEGEIGVVCEEMKKGTVPCRVTHNDTKLNNVLFDKTTKKGICVIDLDTVMPGSLLYDFGDALRYGANTAAEDETDLSKVSFDLALFRAFTEGFLSEMKEAVTEKERELLPFSAKLMTYECGIRFLTDYLNGDTYFKTQYSTHNLDRAKNQLTLCRDIDTKLSAMKEIVNEIF